MPTHKPIARPEGTCTTNIHSRQSIGYSRVFIFLKTAGAAAKAVDSIGEEARECECECEARFCQSLAVELFAELPPAVTARRPPRNGGFGGICEAALTIEGFNPSGARG